MKKDKFSLPVIQNYNLKVDYFCLKSHNYGAKVLF